jgi:FkbM family methyltransferase
MNKYKTILSGLLDQGAFPEDAFSCSKLFKGRKIVIYGAGDGFHWISEIFMKLYGYQPEAILDRIFTRGDTFNGIPAFSPNDYLPTDEEKRNAVVIVSVGKREYHDEIIRSLKGLGFQNIIFLMDVYEIHNPFQLPVALQKSGFEYYLRQMNQIFECLELLADDESREIYTRCVQTHLTRKPVPIPAHPPGEQYTPTDVPLKQGYSRYIYCGVSCGEMGRVLHDIGKVDKFVCFEPNAYQFSRLVDYFQAHSDRIARNVYAYPCAVYSREAQMRFIYTDDSFGNRISEKGQVQVQCVSIDHAIPGFNPTFISMDIEGTELEALKGAENTIKASRPDLAVCVYHAPNHLWEIALYLNSLELGYRFYLRNYTTFTIETVLYATT